VLADLELSERLGLGEAVDERSEQGLDLVDVRGDGCGRRLLEFREPLFGAAKEDRQLG
jgi:hypothetical protein